MKTNSFARRLVKLHAVLLWAVVLAIALVEFKTGHLLASRIGQNYATVTPTSAVAVPAMGIGDFMAAAGW